MLETIKKDFMEKYNDPEGKDMHIEIAYSYDIDAAEKFKDEIQAEFPNHDIVVNPLSLSVACHIGPGAIAVAYSKKIK